MVYRLLLQIINVAVASQANAHGVGLGQSGLPAGVRAVAVGAIAHGAGVRHLGRLNQLGLVVMAGHAQRLDVGLRQHDFSILHGRMAGFAALGLERRMKKLGHQLGRRRLVRIVALQAVGGGEGLVPVGLLEVRILGVMAVQAERRGRLGQMEPVLHGRRGARLVRQVAGIAPHVQRGMTAALFRNIQSGLVATEAEVLFFPARHRLQKLILVVARVRIVAGEAIAHRRRMHRPLDVRRFLVRMAGEAKPGGSGRDQLDPRHVLVHPHLMAAQTARGHGRMHGFALGLVVVALHALGGVGVLVQRHGMNRRAGRQGRQRKQGNRSPDAKTKPADALMNGRLAVPDAMVGQCHTVSEECVLHEARRNARRPGRNAARAQATERKQVLIEIRNRDRNLRR